MDSYISLTRTSDSLAAFRKYAAYGAGELPRIWLPDACTAEATSSGPANAGFSPLRTLLPEYWHFTRQPERGRGSRLR